MTDSVEDRLDARNPRYTGSVVIIGTGSVGSLLAAKLAALGFSPLYLLDKGILEPENIPRHYLGGNEIGDPKAVALADRIRDDFPGRWAFGEEANFMDWTEDEQVAYISQAQIVVAATDSIDCQRRINELCYRNNIAAIFPGIWVDGNIRPGEVGYILRVVPADHTPCFQCYTNWRPRVSDAEAVEGSGLDVENFTGVAAGAVISLYYPDDPHADVFDPERLLTLVHSNTRISPAIQHIFNQGPIKNIRIPFPPTPCPVCGGHAPPTLAPPPPPAPPPLVWQPRPNPTPFPAPHDPRAPRINPAALLGGLLAVALLIWGVVALTHHSGSSTQAASGSQSGLSDSGGSGGLPDTASTAFNVTPSFATKSATASGPAGDNAGDNFSVSLTSTLNDFTLDVAIQATYDPSQFTAGTPASTLFGQSCMDITGPTTQDGMAGETYREPPLSTNLTDSGGTITGTLEYAAILPGSYGFDYACLGGNAAQNPIDVGSVTTTNLGISDGNIGNMSTDNYNAVTVFAEEKSTTDTVILFGAVGTSQGSLQPSSDSCIIYNPPPQDPTIAHPASISVSEQKQSNGQWYELGSLTFNLSASQISNGTPAYDAVFFYNCGAGNSATDVISRGGGVTLH